MGNLKEVVSLFEQHLDHLYDQGEIRQLCLMTYQFVTGKPAVHYALEKSANLPPTVYEKYMNTLEELCSGRPIQYILGQAEFYGNAFIVNEHTLIPRQETEELVDWIIKDNVRNQQKRLTILDIGTGSGCIAISLKRKLENADLTGLDISKEALKIARINAQRLAPQVEFIEADILEWEMALSDGMNLDIIVSNPPYITPKEQLKMHKNVLQFEPHSALFVEDHFPLLFYSAIADFGKSHLNSPGHLYCEINQYLAAETADLLRKKGYKEIEIRKDINQVNRMIKASI
ncbi:MAG: peptide chain release factor N(5)-glutamine methyltransferase [Sphingobacterium sp.]|uniref:peptide chain release factor N(5)-glutamine methyltransferase n=1 Tax=Sphingobacterium sp. JB170 TaxID=1434842 RepID=UPI00097F2257|nr:peptide chain release factor N(5)-glutamine methyltransferase [Sphingobacterium sp. JB170]SJN45215.1 Protein-N(5)-glutamine methyltransferase PrmC, methylates polypeptide chain release factors RF1 and RF2 [Sphingobacterium sp. JB170]